MSEPVSVMPDDHYYVLITIDKRSPAHSPVDVKTNVPDHQFTNLLQEAITRFRKTMT